MSTTTTPSIYDTVEMHAIFVFILKCLWEMQLSKFMLKSLLYIHVLEV